jgi:hypothetical protein
MASSASALANIPMARIRRSHPMSCNGSVHSPSAVLLLLGLMLQAEGGGICALQHMRACPSAPGRRSSGILVQDRCPMPQHQGSSAASARLVG